MPTAGHDHNDIYVRREVYDEYRKGLGRELARLEKWVDEHEDQHREGDQWFRRTAYTLIGTFAVGVLTALVLLALNLRGGG